MRRLALALIVVLLASCDREPSRTPPPTPHPPSTLPHDGGRLQRRLETDVHTLNYILHAEEEERQVLAYLYEPLVALDQNLQPVPGLVAKWEIGDGGRSYTLHLDPRATFSDRTPVLAGDVVFTIHKILDEEAPQFASWFEGIDRERTRALDDRTVQVVFKEPRVAQLFSFNLSVVPEHVYGKGDLAKNSRVVGNGPYVLERRVPGQSLLLRRRADYWREKPHIDSILFRVVPDESVAWRALTRGQLDVARINNDLWWREKDQPEVKEQFTFVSAWLLSYNCFAWNLDDPLFADVRVRQALARAFDRNAVIQNLYHGEARPVSGPFTPDQWAYNEAVTPVEFNLEAARALLSSAGWRDSDRDGVLDRGGKKFAFTMLIPASEVAREQSQILQDALKKAGIEMQISTLEGAAFFDRVLKRNFQAAFFAWALEPDPDRDLYGLFHSTQKAPEGLNVGGYANPEADGLIEQGRVEFDRARRTDLYHQLHELLARDQPYLWTVQVASKWAVRRRVQNVRVSKGLGLFLWEPGPMAWWLKE